jgi:hypothetical protein
MKKLILLVALLQTACAGMTQVGDNFKHEFNYDYRVPGKTQAELYSSARNFMALTYQDSNKVIKAADEKAGTIIGIGVVGWNILPGSSQSCNYNYNIKFAAKDNKARLQLDLLGPIGGCGWDRPSEDGYQQISAHFDAIGNKLGTSLSGQLFKDF